MIPKHKCTPYCDPDEGIHCLPNAGVKNLPIQVFKQHFPQLEILKIQEELDVTEFFLISLVKDDRNFKYIKLPIDSVGYLMWIREKSWKPELNWTN